VTSLAALGREQAMAPLDDALFANFSQFLNDLVAGQQVA